MPAASSLPDASPPTAGLGLGGPPVGRIRPMRDAVTVAAVVLAVSASGLGVTYYFSHQDQIEAVQNELLQVARIAAASIDGDAHRRLDSKDMDGGPEYLRVLEPLVRVQRAARDAFFMYTGILSRGKVYFVLDTATVYRAPGDTSPRVALMEPYDPPDPDMVRSLETRTPQVNASLYPEPERTYLSAYAPFFDSAGEVAGVVAVDMWVRDLEARLARLRRVAQAASLGLIFTSFLTGVIVYRLRAAAAEGEAHDREIMRALAEARDAAEQSSRSKSAFLAMMSHELRTPLNAIVGYADLMHDELSDRGETQLAVDVDRVRIASRHLADIISDILDYSKAEVGRMVISPTAVDIGAVLDDVGELMRPRATAKGIDLRIDVRPGVAPVHVDPVRLRQVLLNLIGNAVKFTERGAVTVRLRPSPARPSRVLCLVHDTGVGIAADKRHLLFEPFSQADSSLSRAAGGTGLGLAISRRLVDAMGGSLRMKSQAGRGSTFRMSLPVEPPAEAS